MKEKSPKDKLQAMRSNLQREFQHHAYLKEHGGQDPFWPDGTNMNLTRNHIIYEKRQIMELCSISGLDLPPEYFIPTPEEVDDDYMANLDQTDRVERLRQQGNRLTTKKLEEYVAQGSFL